MSKRKRTSVVWEFFELAEVTQDMKIKKAVCTLCEGLQLVYTGGTTNLLNYLETKHPVVCKDTTGEVSSSKTKQKMLHAFQAKLCSPDRANGITNWIVEFVVRDLHPIATVDGAGFTQLMKIVEPGYKVPLREHTTTTCRCIYTAIAEELLITISSPHMHIAFTTDLWPSKATEAYLTITCHFIAAEWGLVSRVLVTREMSERHTGEHIAARLRDAATEWRMPNKRVSAIVHDNAANMRVTVQELGWEGIYCFGHTLQLAINNGLTANPLSRLAAAACKLVGHFKHSVVATTALKQQLNVPEHHLMQDVATRWNSTYIMFERLLEQRWVIYAVLHDDQVTLADHRNLHLKEDQWNLLQQMVTALKPLQVVTTALCEAKEVSISLIYPVISGLIKKHLVVGNDDLPPVKSFKRTVVTEIKQRFSPDSLNTAVKAPVLAAALDPHYHQLKFLSDSQRSMTYATLKEKVQEIHCGREEEESQLSRPNDAQPTALSFLLEDEDSKGSASVG